MVNDSWLINDNDSAEGGSVKNAQKYVGTEKKL